MDNNKNKIIAALAALLIIGSIWGAIGNNTAKSAKQELKATQAELQSLKAEAGQEVQAAPPADVEKETALKEAIAEKEGQLVKAKQELVELRKARKGLEALVSERDARIQKLEQVAKAGHAKGNDAEVQTSELQALTVQLQGQAADLQAQLGAKAAELAAAEEQLAKLADTDAQLQSALEENNKIIADLQEKLAAAEANLATLEQESSSARAQEDEIVGNLTREFETAQAQVIGLEKIVEEKNAALEETSRELDRVKINMDVLLSKISDQQDALQELSAENQELVKNLTAKNEEAASLQEQLMQVPVQN